MNKNLFNSLNHKITDIYAFNIGCYILWAITTTIRYIKYYLQTHDLVLFLQQIFKWFTIGAKSVVLLFLWVCTNIYITNDIIILCS